MNGRTAEAIEEYRLALDLRKSICLPHDKALSDAYFALAIAHIYHSSESQGNGNGSGSEGNQKEVDPLEEKEAACRYYALSREVRRG